MDKQGKESLRGRSKFRRLSTLDLTERIAFGSDKEALRELHDDRPLFRANGRNGLLMIDYIARLRDRELDRGPARRASIDAIEAGYDGAVAKFAYLPVPEAEDPQDSGPAQKLERRGPDCRCYYKAFAAYARRRLKERGHVGRIEEEALVAYWLQRFVTRHFYLSVKDGERRANRLWGRYAWRVKGGVLRLLMPRTMTGAEKRRWLEGNIQDPDPSRPGERERVQAVVDERLGPPRIVGYYDERMDVLGDSDSEEPSPWSVVYGVTTHGMRKAVADEKAQDIASQRPAVRVLGKRKLRRMIRRIFEELAGGDYVDADIAREFDLSKATFSRFAGSRWPRREDDGAGVPDLWRNTARVLANVPVFREAAKAAGVWPNVQKALDEGGGTSHA